MELKIDETGQAVIPVLACVLNQLCARNDALPVQQQHVSKFHALRPPSISIADYLTRIGKYAACSGECFILALVYVDRVIQRNPSFVVNYLNIHRLLITGVMLAAKFFDDQYFNNAYYAKVGGVPTNEINTLEVEFLFMTNFALFVTTETYAQYYNELGNHAMNGSCNCVAESGGVPELNIPPLIHESQLILPENWQEIRNSISDESQYEPTAHEIPLIVLSVDWEEVTEADINNSTLQGGGGLAHGNPVDNQFLGFDQQQQQQPHGMDVSEQQQFMQGGHGGQQMFDPNTPQGPQWAE